MTVLCDIVTLLFYLLLVLLFTQLLRSIITSLARKKWNTPHAYKGKRIIITGATSGIGKAVAEEYAKRGATLILVARRDELLKEVASLCLKIGAADVYTFPMDVSSKESCEKLIATTVEKYGGLDILVLNAGIPCRTHFEEMDLATFHNVMNINFYGYLYPTHYALKYLKSSRGKIIVVSSLQGKTGTPSRTAYSASKHALHGLFDSLRFDVGKWVTISIVCPGYVSSDFRAGEGHVKSKMMSPTECAIGILRAEQDNTREVVMTVLAKVGLVVKMVLPDFVADLVVRGKTSSVYSKQQ